MFAAGSRNFRLELESDLDLSLSIVWSVLRTLADDLSEGSITDIRIRSIKLSAVEQVEVVHLKNGREAFSKEETLSHVGILVVEGGTFERAIVPYGVAEDIL